MKPEISIVVPIYKVEDYLDRCVQSLIKQTFTNIEIILVNDGSPDRCPKMCEIYAENDQRIRVIHKKNGGLSEARNYGMKIATGQYLLFVDSDDYIEADTCERFMQFIVKDKVDIVIGSAKKVEKSRTKIMEHSWRNEEVLTGKEFLFRELSSNTMYMAIWLSIYRRDFLLENSFEFKPRLLHEDEQFTPRVFLKANSVVSTNILFYNYIIRDSSITMSKDLSENAVHIIQTCNELACIYDEIEDDSLRLLLNDALVTKYLSAFKMGKLYRRKFNNLIDKRFLIQRSYMVKNKLQVYLLVINKRLYYTIYKLISLKHR